MINSPPKAPPPLQNLTAKKPKPQPQTQPQLQVHVFLSATPDYFLNKSTKPIITYNHSNLDITIYLLEYINSADKYIKTILDQSNNLYIIKNSNVNIINVPSQNHKIINISIPPNITIKDLKEKIEKLINTPSPNGGFYKKYLKYKSKYLNKKNKLLN